jgi:hypothetical protein
MTENPDPASPPADAQSDSVSVPVILPAKPKTIEAGMPISEKPSVPIRVIKTFGSILFWAVKTLFLVFVVVGLFTLCGWLISDMAEHSIPGSRTRWILNGWILVPLYFLLGLAAGVAEAFALTMKKMIALAGAAVNWIIDPFSRGILARLEIGRKECSLDEFRVIVKEQIEGFRVPSERQSIHTAPKIVTFFFLRLFFRALKWVYLNDFLEKLKKDGKTKVASVDVERFSREQVMELILDFFREQYDYMQYATWAATVLICVGPMVLIYIVAF